MEESSRAAERLTADNWSTWKVHIKHFLILKGLWKFCTGDNAETDASNQEKTLAYLITNISASQLYLVSDTSSAKEAWTRLSQHYDVPSLQTKIMLKRRLFRCELGTKGMVDHLRDFKGLVDKLSAINSPISEEDQVVTLLGSLPERFSALVTTLEGKESLTMSEVTSKLLYEEEKMKNCPTATAYSTQPNSTQQYPSDAATAYSTQHNSTQQYPFVAGVYHGLCFGCGSPDHYQRDCPTKTRGRGRGRGRMSYYRGNQPSSQYSLSTTMYRACSLSSDWVVDSGATRHMCNNASLFIQMEMYSSTANPISLGDGRTIFAAGCGTVSLATTHGDLYVHDVLYVPDLIDNLFSVHAGSGDGIDFIFSEDRCWIKRGRRVIATATKSTQVYIVDGGSANGCALVSRTDDINLWHNRLGHVSKDRLLKTPAVVNGLRLDGNFGFCE